MIAPDRITTELDAALKDYTAGNDCAVRFVTIDQVDMLAEFYLHNRATEAKLAKAVKALREWDDLIKHQYSGSREAMSDMTYAAQHTAALLAEIEGGKT
jgi:hypothetical protein